MYEQGSVVRHKTTKREGIVLADVGTSVDVDVGLALQELWPRELVEFVAAPDGSGVIKRIAALEVRVTNLERAACVR